MEDPQISVVIPTFNRADMVCDCIDSVLAQQGVTFEIVVVDDCSPDNTGARIRERYGNDPRVRYMRNERNMQLAATHNNGARAATGDYLFFLDDDNILGKDALKELLECFTRHPDAGLVAPLAIQKRKAGEEFVWTIGSDFNRWTSQPNDYLPNIPIDELPSDTTRFKTSYCPNAFAVRKQDHNSVRGFCEELPFYGSTANCRHIASGHRGDPA